MYGENFLLGAIPMNKDGEEEVIPQKPTYVPPHMRADAFRTSGAGGSFSTTAPVVKPVVTQPAPPQDVPPAPPAPPKTPDAPSTKGDTPNLGEEPQPNTDEPNGNQGGASAITKYLPYVAGAALIYFLFLRKR